MKGICALCLNTADLKISHIIPKFVWRWIKKPTSAAIRTSRNPNQKIQDGPKIFLLCDDCEQRLSEWEKLFSEKIFLPLHASEPVTQRIVYEEWALKFAVSVSWRVAIFFQREYENKHLTQLQCQLSNDALEIWRKFLMGEMKSIGIFDQHLLPVDVIADYTGEEISPFLNRYFLRNVHMDIISTNDSVYIYTKMCKLILFGRIQEKHKQLWKGMKLHAKGGDIRPRNYLVPEYMSDYWNRKADEVKNILKSLSPRQQEIGDKAFYKNVDAIANSEIFRAMQYDVAHSGQKAFSNRKRKGQDDGLHS